MFWILKQTRLSSGAFFNAINNNLGSGGGSGYLNNRNGNQSNVSRKGYNKLSTLVADEDPEEADEEEEEEDGVEEEDVSMGGGDEGERTATEGRKGTVGTAAVGGAGGLSFGGGCLGGGGGLLSGGGGFGVKEAGGGVGVAPGTDGDGDNGTATQQLLNHDHLRQQHREQNGSLEEEDEEDDEDDEDDPADDSLCYTDYEISEDSDYEESLTCNVCDRYFPTMRLLAQHQQKKRHFGCSACDSLFPSLMALEHHKEEFDHWSETEEAAFTDDGGSDVAAGSKSGGAKGSKAGGRGSGKGAWSEEDEEGDRDEDAISEEHERLLL